jgi:hypothetical protein
MDDTISRRAAIKAIDDLPNCYNGYSDTYDKAYNIGVMAAIAKVKRMPTIDAVPVVLCKDCKYYREGKVLSPQKFCFRLKGRDGKAIGYNFAEDDFCSYGERSEDVCKGHKCP